jgi:hypothetical protein
VPEADEDAADDRYPDAEGHQHADEHAYGVSDPHGGTEHHSDAATGRHASRDAARAKRRWRRYYYGRGRPRVLHVP